MDVIGLASGLVLNHYVRGTVPSLGTHSGRGASTDFTNYSFYHGQATIPPEHKSDHSVCAQTLEHASTAFTRLEYLIVRMPPVMNPSLDPFGNQAREDLYDLIVVQILGCLVFKVKTWRA